MTNNADAIDRSCGTARLTSVQKQRLAMLSRQAFAAQGRAVGETKFDLWRHEQAIKAVGRRISEALQADFLPLKAHFLNLLGKPVAAMQAHMRHETEPQRVALWKLARECEAKGLPLSYATTICRHQNRCRLEDASAKQLWRLVFTIRNRKRGPAAPEDDNIPY